MILTVTLKSNYELPLNIYLHNHKLAPVTKAKYLGITLDYTLSFIIHVVSISKKANSVLSFIQRNLRECHQKVKIYAYS